MNMNNMYASKLMIGIILMQKEHISKGLISMVIDCEVWSSINWKVYQLKVYIIKPKL